MKKGVLAAAVLVVFGLAAIFIANDANRPSGTNGYIAEGLPIGTSGHITEALPIVHNENPGSVLNRRLYVSYMCCTEMDLQRFLIPFEEFIIFQGNRITLDSGYRTAYSCWNCRTTRWRWSF